MIDKYISKLTRTNPINNKQSCETKNIDLVLSGGAFNGSYMLGALYYLKKMEKDNLIKIDRISCSSIGSLLGVLYITDNLSIFNDYYKIIFKKFKKHKNLSSLFKIKKTLLNKLPDNVCELLNKKLYITYSDINLGKKHIQNSFSDKYELVDCIIRSCYVPYLINYKPSYKDKFIDGLLPYFFEDNRENNKQILYINLFTPDKLIYAINIKNETTNLHRVVSGINDIHMFFLKNENTLMCSFLNKWFIYEYLTYYISYFIEIIIIALMYLTKFLGNITITKQTFKYLIHFCLDNYFI
jgi:hypothetical protein